ncbi:MAG: ATP-binding protein [Spirochaetia bacterium]|nr:ATP-binding protein [Spirochaetia bacterium]
MPESPGAETRNHIRLQFPSQPRYVATVRDTVYRFCLQHGFTRSAAFDLKMVTGEALANIIQHVYNNRADKPIFLEMLFYTEFAEIRFRDLGPQIPIAKNLKKDLTDYRESGLGLFLIEQLTDFHFFDQSAKVGTTLIVKKKLG